MTKESRTSKQHSLSRRLIALILLFYFSIATSFTVVQLYGEFRVEKNNLKIQVESLGETFRSILSEAIWNYDDIQVKATIAGIYKNSEVFGIEVHNQYEDSWALGYYRNEDGTIAKHSNSEEGAEPSSGEGGAVDEKSINFDYNQLYEVNIDLYREYKGKLQSVGTQTIYFSSVTVFERTWMTFVITFVAAMLKTFSLWVISVLVVNRIVAAPLGELTTDIESFQADTLVHVPTSFVSRAEHKKDELYYLQNSFFTLRDELISRNKEIEERKNRLESMVAERTKSLDDTLVELRDASQVKDIFIATMSHEIRTPLNSVLGCVGLLKRTELTDRQRNLATKISRGGKDLMSMLDDIMDWSKMEANMLVLESIPLDFVGIVRYSVETFSASATAKSLTLNYTPNEKYSSLPVLGDPTRLSQVLNNLLSNGIKFTAEGFVTLSLEILSVEALSEKKLSPVGQIVNFNLVVEDSGIGIDEAQQSSLFVAFKQADGSTTREYGGSGLGLAICKKIVEAMGGAIRIESTLTQGSKFIVSLSLPLAKRLEVNAAEEPIDDIDGHYAKILFIDDSGSDDQQVMAVLQGFGHVVTRINKFDEAIDQFQQNHLVFDLILINFALPEMQCCEAIRKVRAFETTSNLRPIKIIGIAENNSNECLKAGMDALTNKPFDPSELLSLVNSITGNSCLENNEISSS